MPIWKSQETYRMHLVYIYIYIYMSSLSPQRAISTNILHPRWQPFFIIHCVRQVFRATFCISTELLYVGSSWSSNLCLSMWRGPREYITYEFVYTSPAVFCMNGSSNFDSFSDGWLVAVKLLLCAIYIYIYIYIYKSHLINKGGNFLEKSKMNFFFLFAVVVYCIY